MRDVLAVITFQWARMMTRKCAGSCKARTELQEESFPRLFIGLTCLSRHEHSIFSVYAHPR